MRIKMDLSCDTPEELATAEALLGKWLDTVKFIKGQQAVEARPLVKTPIPPPPAPKFYGGGKGVPIVPGTSATIPDAIREAINNAPAKFSSSDIYAQFPKHRAQVKEVLKALKTQERLWITIERRGRSPAFYEKTAKFSV